MGKWNELYRLRTTYQRSGKVDVVKLRKDTEAYLTKYYKPKEYKPDEPIKQGEDRELEILSEIWAFVAENIEREAWKSYTREEWAELERQYVEKSDYTEQDLTDDILIKFERGLFTAEEAHSYFRRYRACNYRFCENVFKPNRKDQRYCTADCRKREANAKGRYKQTGTYLPSHVYKDNRDDTVERNYKGKEITYNLGEAGNGVDEENAENTAARLIRHYNPVNYKEERTAI